MRFSTIVVILLVSLSPLVIAVPVGLSSSASDESIESIEVQEYQPRLNLQKRSVIDQEEASNGHTTQAVNLTSEKISGNRRIKFEKSSITNFILFFKLSYLVN